MKYGSGILPLSNSQPISPKSDSLEVERIQKSTILKSTKEFKKSKSFAIVDGCKYDILYIYIVEFKKENKVQIENNSIGGNLLLEAAKLKATPSALSIMVGSRFRPLNILEHVYIIYYILLRNY